MDNGTTERRAHARYDKTFELHQLGAPEVAVARMVARNLSLGGLYCTSTRAFDEMTRLAVRLMLPNGSETDPIDVEAVVVRARRLSSPLGDQRYELALYFTSIEDGQRERLARFLTS